MNYQEEIKNICNKYKYVGVNTLLVNEKGEFTSTEGVEDLVTNKPLSLNTIFRIASVSKIIVALGIMKLYEKDLLKITDDISLYLGYEVRNPNFKDVPITIEMLMTQTSSISDGNDSKRGYDGVNGPKIDIPLEDLLTKPTSKYYLETTFSSHKPGTHWEYSNFGCGILACIIEKVSGEYFSDFIRKEVLLPLEIDGSFRISDIIHKENVASLYDYQNDEFVLERNLEMFLNYEYPRYELGNNYRMPAGGLFISILDLAKIMKMLMNKGVYENIQVFKKLTIDYMMNVHWQGTSDDPSYRKKGLQLLILESYGETLYGHFGSAYGLKSYMLFNEQKGMIFLCNGANFRYNDKIGITYFQDELIKFMLKY